jgi:hypothetical protein
LIAQLVRELAQVQEQLLVRGQELGLELELQLAQAQVLESVQVQELQLVRELVQHLPHQQLQSRFQPQRSRLLQLESLSTLQQLAKVLQCQLCRSKLRTMARRQQLCRQLF